MTSQTLTLLAGLALASLVAACEGHGTVAAASAETGYATGVVVDTQGNPIAGARILLDNSVFHASYIDGTTREDGTYRIKVQPGAWKAHATMKKEYNGKTYSLELHPDDNDSFTDDGVVRNFAWKLEGRMPDNDYGYYGGFIQLSTDHGFEGDLDDVELVLTPDGPLIDGSAGRTLRLRKGGHYWAEYYHIEDIPIGRYTVTASLESDGRTQPLKIQDWHAQDEFMPALRLDFWPKSGGASSAEASIVIGH